MTYCPSICIIHYQADSIQILKGTALKTTANMWVVAIAISLQVNINSCLDKYSDIYMYINFVLVYSIITIATCVINFVTAGSTLKTYRQQCDSKGCSYFPVI